MSVVSKGEIEINQRGTSRLNSTVYNHYGRFWSDRTDTAYEVMQNPFCPQLGETHRSDLNARCVMREVQQVDRIIRPDTGQIGLHWIIGAEYNTDTPNAEENPLLEPARIRYVSEQFQKETFRNRDGNLLINTAGLPVKGNFIDDSRCIAHVSKNVSGTLSFLMETPDVVNLSATEFDGYTYAANTLKYKFISLSEYKTRGTTVYKTFEFQIQFRRDKWKLYYPNEGRMQNVFGELYPCYDGSGMPSSVPMGLDLTGAQLSDQADTFSLEADVYETYNFENLRQYWE